MKTFHPPGGATALIAVIKEKKSTILVSLTPSGNLRSYGVGAGWTARKQPPKV